MAPNRVAALFDQFAAAWARGERPSLDDYLAQAGPEAGVLARMVEEYVSRAPLPEPRVDGVELLEAFLEREPGLLALRRRRGLRVDEVVDRLVKTLALDLKLRGKLKARYQQLEGGLLDPRRVSERVWDALAGAVDPSAREAARWGRPAPAAAPAFRVKQEPMFESAAFEAREAMAAKADREPPDEVDVLFGIE